jgi:hypothetical protein
MVILIFLVWQLSISLKFRYKKQREQRGAADGDLLAKGQAANATERSACRIEPVWDSVMKSCALPGPPNAMSVARAAQDTIQSSGSAYGLSRQTEPKPSDRRHRLSRDLADGGHCVKTERPEISQEQSSFRNCCGLWRMGIWRMGCPPNFLD